MRKVIIPKPLTFSGPPNAKTGPWGLIEFLLERVLSLPENLGSVEVCNRVVSLTKKLSPYRGLECSDKILMLTDREHEFLSERFQAGLQVIARGNSGVLPPDILVDLAGYARAFHAAEFVEDKLPEGAAMTQGPGIA
jgi:hypothetical protein